jgi:PAS domain S-box-containing protein
MKAFLNLISRVEARKVIFFLLAVVLVPLLLIQAFTYYRWFQVRKDTEIQANLELARSFANTFDTYIDEVLRTELAIGMAATASPSLSRSELRRILTRTAEVTPGLIAMSWISSNGQILISTDPLLEGTDISKEDYYRKILSGQESFVSDLFVSQISRQPVFAIGIGILDPKGILLGIIRALVLPDKLNDVLAVSRAKDAGISLIDSKGVHVFRWPLTVYTWEQRNWLKHYPIIAESLAGKESTSIVTSESTGLKRFVAFTPVAKIGWVAAASRAEDDVIEPILSAMLSHGMLFLITLSISLIIALLLSRPIVSSISRLRDQALALGKGQLEKVEIAYGPRELNELSNTFNEVAEKIRVREEALRESEERYRDLFETMDEGFCIIELIFDADSKPIDYRFLKVNPSFTKQTGLQDAEGKLMRDLVPDLEAYWFEIYGKIALTGESRHFVNEARALNRWYNVYAYHVGKQEERQVAIIFNDYSEYKRAEEHLRNEKLRLEVAQESAQAGTFEWNIQKNQTIWSDQLKALYGFAPGEFKGFENWSSRVHPEDLRKSKKAILESLRTGKYDDDFRVIWPDGSLHWLAARGKVVFDEHGSPLLMTGINMDVTERKRAEEALARSRDELEEKVRERTSDLSLTAEELRKSEEAYRLLVELNPVGVFRHVYDTVNNESKRLHCNDAQLKLLGYSSLDEYLKELPENTIIEEDWNKYISSLISIGKIVNFPAQMKRKDGRIIWVLLNAITRSDGKQLFVEGAMTDKSEQKRTEERLPSARKKLRAKAAEIVMADERSRQHFAADLHDTVIQTIGAAKLRTQIIQDDIPEKALKDFQQLQDLISQSITQARFIMAEMSPPVLNELGFIPAMEWLTEQIENQHGIKVEFSTNGFTPLQHEIQVLLFQATRELLMNVVKHAKAHTALVKVSGGKQKVRIEIIDDGRGFDKRQAFRTDVSSGGFGLFSIRERLRHFGGHLIIQSEEGKGTRVVMTAPHTLEAHTL